MKRLVATIVLLAASPAFGFVRTQTSTGTPVDWNGHCPQLKLGGPPNPQLSTERLRAALVKSADAWNEPTQSCDNPRLVIEAAPSAVNDIGYDGTNVIVWRLPGFCEDPANGKDDVCTSPSAAAVTTLFYIDKPGDAHDGELLDADMEINAVDFEYGDDGSPDKIDIGNTLTHELGHVLGLDHTCYTVPGSAPPTDSTGKSVPHCFPLTALPPSVTQATMFNFESPGEIDRRLPTPEETGGICSIYDGHPLACSNDGGCSIAPPAHAVPLGLIVLGVGLVVLARRRRRAP